MHMDHKFSEIGHVTPLFEFFLVVHLQMQCPGGSFRSLEGFKAFSLHPQNIKMKCSWKRGARPLQQMDFFGVLDHCACLYSIIFPGERWRTLLSIVRILKDVSRIQCYETLQAQLGRITIYFYLHTYLVIRYPFLYHIYVWIQLANSQKYNFSMT